MSEKQKIIDAITRVAQKLGRAPTQSEFSSITRITRHHVTRSLGSWLNAVRDAGLTPRFRSGPEDSELLSDWGRLVRKKGAAPSRKYYCLHGRFHPRTFESRFGRWSQMPLVFRRFALRKPEWTDVLRILRETKAFAVHPEISGQITYGDPIDARPLRHEPMNEQGVVLLFGMLAHELGYIIESVQTAFPDCEAKRQVSPGRWQRVRIEFEYESRKFREHQHPSTGCDLIVCWRHNWRQCPKHIEVLELATLIKEQVV